MDENPYRSPRERAKVPSRPAKPPRRQDYRKLPIFMLLFAAVTATFGGAMLLVPGPASPASFFTYAVVLAVLGIGLLLRALRKERKWDE